MHGRRFRHILGIKRSNTLLLTNIRRRSYLGKACTTNRHESFVYNCIPKHKKEESLRKQGHSDYIFGVVVLIRKLESLWKLFHYINIVTVFWLIVTKNVRFSHSAYDDEDDPTSSTKTSSSCPSTYSDIISKNMLLLLFRCRFCMRTLFESVMFDPFYLVEAAHLRFG